MSNSSLVSYTNLSPHKRSRNGKKISKITIHHAAVVNASLEGLARGFQGSRTASANYGIDSKGRIGMFVEEEFRAITSSNTANDEMAVTIEVANSGGAPDWKISDAAYEALINLCVDICKRNDMPGLDYTGDANGTLTRHNMFAKTTCPGPYLQNKFTDIAIEVNKQLDAKVAPQVKVLSRGSKGQEVKELQELLIKLDYDLGSLGADGDFGSKTQTAVKKFQKSVGLTQDGIVGPQTLEQLRIAAENLAKKGSYTQKEFVEDVQRILGAGVDGIPGPITLSKTITVSRYKNRKHPVVLAIQKRLYAMGYTEVGEADGIAGSCFDKAMKHFQKDFGLYVDGEATA
jgi:peptidoglycan hydrolase-like protein with peptidoglycan-binding domain